MKEKVEHEEIKILEKALLNIDLHQPLLPSISSTLPWSLLLLPSVCGIILLAVTRAVGQSIADHSPSIAKGPED